MMTCIEFFNEHYNDMAAYMDELYLLGEKYNTTKVFEYLVDLAIDDDIELADVDTWEYDDYIYQTWKSGDWKVS